MLSILTYNYTNDKTFKWNEGKIMIYLDYAATTRISEEALYVLTEASKKYFGNASSLHDIGTRADDALQVCRQQLADMIRGEKSGVYFTSGGSEANILALLSLIKGNKEKGNHLITTAVEHASVYNLFQQLEKEGYEVTYLPIYDAGAIRLEELQGAIRENTILASIHHGNPEIGTIQPMREIGEILHQHGVLYHADCVQTFGEIPIDVQTNCVDSLSISSHKLYGPKGTGMCYISPSVNWRAQFEGTTHENGFRPGTVDVPSVLAFTTAAQQAVKQMDDRRHHYQALRNQFIKRLADITDQVIIEGGGESQLPHIIGLSFLQAQGQYIMLECNRYGLAVSTGSACQVGMQDPSRTMISLGKSVDEAKQFVRISLGNETKVEEIDEAVLIIDKVLRSL